jgi:hypothetical protein
MRMVDQTSHALGAFRAEFSSLRSLTERAVAQLDDRELFTTLDGEGNSVAILLKHVGGNLRSRWTDIFETDGEKPDRWRDREFEREAGDTRESILARWETGWRALHETFERLGPADLDREILIRGEKHTVIRALTRSLAHTAGHVHQAVLLARHWRGDRWETLSIPRGESDRFRRDFTDRASHSG